jgi:hypothetical protein
LQGSAIIAKSVLLSSGCGSGRIGIVLADWDFHPGHVDPDPYPFQLNVKLYGTFFLKTLIYYVQNIENYDTYDNSEKYETRETVTVWNKVKKYFPDFQTCI